MPNVVFVAPFTLADTLRFVRAAAALPGVRLAVLSQEPEGRLPPDVLRTLAGYEQVGDALDASAIETGVRALGRRLGGVDALLGILEPLQVPLAEVRERLRIRGMDATEARNFRDKARMKEILAANDLPCARHRLCASAEDALRFAGETGYPLVVKPPAGAGAKATVRCPDQRELEAALRDFDPSPARAVLVEEFVQGREFSFDSVSLHGRHVFHSISEYHPTPLEVLENPWIQWTVVLPRELGPGHEAILELGPKALTALGMVTGMSHLEWFRRADGTIAIGEVAARPPGAQFLTLISHAHDTDMYRAWAQLMVFETFTPPPRRFAAGAAYLRAQGKGRIRAIAGLEQAQSEFGALVVEAKLPEPGQPRGTGYEGDGYVLVRHPETRVVEAVLQRLVRTLRVETDG